MDGCEADFVKNRVFGLAAGRARLLLVEAWRVKRERKGFGNGAWRLVLQKDLSLKQRRELNEWWQLQERIEERKRRGAWRITDGDTFYQREAWRW